MSYGFILMTKDVNSLILSPTLFFQPFFKNRREVIFEVFLFEMIFWIDMCCEVQFYMFHELHHSKDLKVFSLDVSLALQYTIL